MYALPWKASSEYPVSEVPGISHRTQTRCRLEDHSGITGLQNSTSCNINAYVFDAQQRASAGV